MENYIPEVINLPSGLEILFEDDHRSTCDHCRQQTILRKKTLTKSTVRALWLMKTKESGTINAKEIRSKLGSVSYATYTELKYWNFIVKVDSSWKITAIGKRFLLNEIQVPENLWVYNDHVRVVPEEMWSRLVSFRALVPSIEISRESVASEAMPLGSI